MAVSSTAIIIAYATDGETTAFTVPFFFRTGADLLVTTVDDSQNVTSYVFDSDYTVSGTLGDEEMYQSGGTVTFQTAPVSGLTLLITRRTPNTQATSYDSNDKFPAKVNEGALDLVVLRAQEIGHHFQGYADGFPSAGEYEVDDWFFIRNAGAFGYKEIICTVAGAPGTWVALNPLGA